MATPRFAAIERTIRAKASCCLCGKSSIEAVAASIPAGPPIDASVQIVPSMLSGLPRKLRAARARITLLGLLRADSLSICSHAGRIDFAAG
jgi:formate dehydrogenase assembly factor FdhD